MKYIKIGSCFSGIGGFELGIERALPHTKTVWQIEQNLFCQKVLKKHYPDAKIYSDIKEITHENLHTIEPVHIIIGGFPCQDVSKAYSHENGQKGIKHGEKSSLWKDMFRIIEYQKPFITVLENVKELLQPGRGMSIVIEDLQKVYDCIEWTIVSAGEMGAPHKRERIFIIGYNKNEISNADSQRQKTNTFNPFTMEKKRVIECGSGQIRGIHKRNYWQRTPIEPPLCLLADGIPNRLARLVALGNSIVPQCSEYIGRLIFESGILQPLYEQLEQDQK